MDDEVLVSFNKASIVFLDLLSLAFNSSMLKPNSFATILAVDDFPIPGGPEIMQALALIFGIS